MKRPSKPELTVDTENELLEDSVHRIIDLLKSETIIK